jgi:hypothetical protein
MSVLVGQVYYPRFKEETKEGEVKTSFMCSLATRKAFIDDSAKPNVFTQAVTYQAGLAKVLNEHFGKEEHSGKAIVAYGHYNEYEWYPDADNPDHDKFFQSFKIEEALLNAGGVKFAEGSKREMTIMVPIKQTTRQFVITGFEFADSSSASKTPRSTSTAPKIKIAGQNQSEPVNAGLPKDDDTPF